MGPKRDSHRKIEELAADDEGLAEKFRKLEADYAHSSYYQVLFFIFYFLFLKVFFLISSSEGCLLEG